MLSTQIVESYQLSTKNILALAYCQELNWLLAAGVEGFIKVISLERKQDQEGVDPLPTVLYGHTDKISALAVLKDYVAVSAGHDRQIRFWDLHTMVSSTQCSQSTSGTSSLKFLLQTFRRLATGRCHAAYMLIPDCAVTSSVSAIKWLDAGALHLLGLQVPCAS